MWQQEFTWFFALFHHEFRQGNRMAFEVLMALAFAHFFGFYNPKQLADFLDIPHQKLYVQLKDWSVYYLKEMLLRFMVKQAVEHLQPVVTKSAARETEIAQKEVILHEANGLLARLNVLHALIQEQTTTAIAFVLIAAMFVVVETAPVVVKLLSKYGPYDAIVEQKETEVTLAAQRKMAEIPDKLQREATHERAIDDMVHKFVFQQFDQALQRAERSPDFAALHETIATRIREEYREAMLRNIRRVFRTAVPDPEVIGVAGAAEASRRKEMREKGGKAKTIQTRIETAKAFVTKKLREYMRRNGSK